MNILAPIDFSENSRNALVYALHFAEKLGGKLFILHAYRLLRPFERVNGTGRSIREELDNESKLKFEQLEKELLANTSVDYEFLIEIGFAADVIESTVSSQDIHLIIMGTKGDGMIPRLFGSTTLSVIKQTRCPVLAIPEDAHYHKLAEIAIASDYSDINNANLFEVVDMLARTYDSSIHVISLNPSNRVDEREIEHAELKLDRYFPTRPVSYHFQAAEDIEDGLTRMVEELHSDILVVIPKDRDFFQKIFRKSVTKKMVLHSNTPILALHE